MKKYFLIFFILYHTLQLSYAGFELKSDTANKKHFLKINTSQLLFKDIHLNYEWEYKQNRFLHTGLGYKFGIKNNEYSTEQPLSGITMFVYPIEITAEEWFYGNIGHTWFIRKQYLLSMDFLFRYSYHDPKYEFYWVSIEDYSETKLLSLRKIASGIRCTIGKKIYIYSKSTRKIQSFFEVFAGIGVRYHYKEWTIYAERGGRALINSLIPYSSPKMEYVNSFKPTLHIGVGFGLAWNRKKLL